MKNGKTLQELAAEVQRQQAEKRDFLTPTSELSMAVQPALTNPDVVAKPGDLAMDLRMPDGRRERFALTRHAHNQIAERLREKLAARPERFGATYHALREQHPDLLAGLVTELWHRGGERRLVRTLDGQARALLSDRYRTIDHDVVLETALRAFQQTGAEIAVVSSEVTERKLYLKIVFPKVEGEIKLGDTVQAGCVLSNSEIGEGSVSLSPLVYRLVCLNGMIAGDKLTQYHVGKPNAGWGEIQLQADTVRADNTAFLLKLRDAITTAMSQVNFNRLVARLQTSTNLPIVGAPQKAVEVTRVRFGLTEGEGDSVLEHLIRGGDLSAWGLSNAITRAAHDVPSYDRATELEALGGKVIAMKPTEWVEIAAVGLSEGQRSTVLRVAEERMAA